MLFFLWHQCLSAPESWPHHRPFIAGAQSIAGTGAKAYWLDLWTGPITNCSDSSPDTTCSWRSLCSVCSCVLEALGWSVSLFTQVTQAGFPPSWHKKHLADLEQLCWCANCCPYLPHECTLWGCLDKSTWKDRCDSSSAVPSKKQESYPWKAPTGEEKAAGCSEEHQLAPAHRLIAKTCQLLTNPTHSIKSQSCWTRVKK